MRMIVFFQFNNIDWDEVDRWLALPETPLWIIVATDPGMLYAKFHDKQRQRGKFSSIAHCFE
jgi:hypothetical protein